uniref:Ovule protein n=1 Tax=Steinernema glaseri TaxID=37863 RepID=A0A1I7YG53_9BILA
MLVNQGTCETICSYFPFDGLSRSYHILLRRIIRKLLMSRRHYSNSRMKEIECLEDNRKVQIESVCESHVELN